MNIIYLSDRPELIPVLANWDFNEWHQYDSSFTMQKALDCFSSRLNFNKIPLTIVALEENVPVGMVSLKTKIPISGYEDRCPWIGSLYVVPDKRGIRVGKSLMAKITNIALDLGYQKLSLFTSVPKAADWYLHIGWIKIEANVYQNHPVTIMEYKIDKKDKILNRKDHIYPSLSG